MRVLRLSCTDSFDPRRGFFDLGIDSLSALEIRAQLEVALGARLPMTVLMDFGNPEALGAYLYEQVLGYEAGASAAASPGPEAAA
jgi:acyl carrier protein